MTSAGEAFRARVTDAVNAPLDGTLGSRFVAPLVTWLVADAAAGDELEDALAGTMRALERVGVLRGRQFVLLGGGEPTPEAKARARALRAALGVPVLVHDPAREGFVAGTLADGTPIELDDELREAEAIVVVAGGPVSSVARTMVPGVAVTRTRAAFTRAVADSEASAWAFVREAERQSPIDLLVWWDAAGEVRAAGGRYALEAFASGHAPEPR